MGGRILYVEYWQNGQKVTEIRRGLPLEIRVVFTVDEEGDYKVCIKRVPGGEFVCIPWTHLKPLKPPNAYYTTFKVVRVMAPPGGYKLCAWLYQKSSSGGEIECSSRCFPMHIVGAETAVTRPVHGIGLGTGIHIGLSPKTILIIGAAAGAIAALLLALKGRR